MTPATVIPPIAINQTQTPIPEVSPVLSGSSLTIFLVTLFLQLFTAIMKQSNFYKTISFVSLTGLLSLGTSSSIFFVLNYYFIWSFILILYCYRTSKHEQNDIAA